MRWLVDGMNVIGSRPDGWWRDRQGAQRRFAEELAAFAVASGDDVAVVFDGRPHAIDAPGVDISFAAIADDEIANDAGEGVLVVTSDAELSARVRASGAWVQGAGAFRRRLDACRETGPYVPQLDTMPEEPNDATPWLPARPSLKSLREAAAACEGCHLHRHATQTVFGEGRAGSRLMFVGEMTGDREDLEGRPFVGPAGRELEGALEAVGIDRKEAYVTNLVKHFSFTERGRRRIHQTPKRFEINACKPWLEEELHLVKPEVLVTLGATAAKALFGTSFRVTQQRGQPLESDLAPLVTATIHPSSILRQQTDEDRLAERHAFTEDLRAVAQALAG